MTKSILVICDQANEATSSLNRVKMREISCVTILKDLWRWYVGCVTDARLAYGVVQVWGTNVRDAVTR